MLINETLMVLKYVFYVSPVSICSMVKVCLDIAWPYVFYCISSSLTNIFRIFKNDFYATTISIATGNA